MWSTSFLSIFVNIETDYPYTFDATSLINNCSKIFDEQTMSIIGNEDAICKWNLDDTGMTDYDIRIDLPSTATIDLENNSNLIVLIGAFRFSIDNGKSFSSLSHMIVINSIRFLKIH